MIGSLLAAWTKLRRPALLWGVYAATILVTVLVTTLTFSLADGGAPAGPPGAPGTGETLASLAEPTGLLRGLSGSVSVFGIIALCVAASATAGEYTTGTLRNLLIRQPRRVRLLAGTWAAVALFTLGGVLAATAVGAPMAAVLAGGLNIDTTAWYTADGLATSARTLGQVMLAAAGYATLGTALGVLTRAPIPAVALGFGWLFLVETIIVGTVDGSSRWLPGQLLSAVASHGTAEVGFAAALVTAAGYLVVAAAAATVSFARRDITA
ncbi:hypothetical protein [Catellatospora sp. NPDC049609]|uniref:hypothetical protein n=1 Tax=Catellatospora sp. NPDC049609 TaxID=3155505 RepID=UPI003436FA26